MPDFATSILQHKVTPFDMSRWPEPLDVTRDTPGVLLKKEQVIKRSRFNQEEVIGISKGGRDRSRQCARKTISGRRRITDGSASLGTWM